MERRLPLNELLRFSMLCEILPFFEPAYKWGPFLNNLWRTTNKVYYDFKGAFIHLASQVHPEFILQFNEETYDKEFWSYLLNNLDMLNYVKLDIGSVVTYNKSFWPKMHYFLSIVQKAMKKDKEQKLRFHNISLDYSFKTCYKYTDLYEALYNIGGETFKSFLSPNRVLSHFHSSKSDDLDMLDTCDNESKYEYYRSIYIMTMQIIQYWSTRMVFSEHDLSENSLENIYISNYSRFLWHEYYRILEDFMDHMDTLKLDKFNNPYNWIKYLTIETCHLSSEFSKSLNKLLSKCENLIHIDFVSKSMEFGNTFEQSLFDFSHPGVTKSIKLRSAQNFENIVLKNVKFAVIYPDK